MTIRKPPGKRLASLLLSLALLLTLVPAMGTTASAVNAKAAPRSVFVNGIRFTEDWLYYKNGDTATTNNESGYNAHYDPVNGVLTLKGYEGSSITVGGADKVDITIKLVGTNTVSGSVSSDMGGNITITSDSNGSLAVTSQANSNYVCGIATSLNQNFGRVTITGNANVKIDATNTDATDDGSAYGIYAYQGITVSDHAFVDISCSMPNSTKKSLSCAGMFVPDSSSGKLTIDTDGDIQIDARYPGSAACSFGLSAPNYALTKVGSMEVQWKKASNTSSSDPFTRGASFDTATHAVNVDTTNCYASYRFGEPHKVTVDGGRLTGHGVKNERSFGNFLAGDTVNLTAPTRYADSANTVEIPFDKWVSNDVTITDGNSQAASFKMPSKDVAVRANYDPFATQPSFKKDSSYAGKGTISFTLVSGQFDSQGAPKIYRASDLEKITGDYSSVDATQKTITVFETTCPKGEYVVGVSYGGAMCYSKPFRVKYTEPSASVVEEVTVEGEANQELEHNYTVTVTLENDTFADPLPSGDWITNLPNGLTETVERTSDTTAKITISGKPLVASAEVMKITIPAGALAEESGTPVKVSIGDRARFNISSNAPTADKIQIGDGSNNKFSADKLYYKNGENGAKGTFSDDSSGYNAKYDPKTGTLTLNGYDGPYIGINGDDGQTVIVKLEGNDSTVKSGSDAAIELMDGVNLVITSSKAASLTLDATNVRGIGPARQANNTGSVTISGSANVTINASGKDGIASGKDVAVQGGASLKIICRSNGLGIFTPSGKVTVDTTSTVDIDVLGCGTGGQCIYASEIAFKNAEKITLKYIPSSGWSPSQPTYPGKPTVSDNMKGPKTDPETVVAGEVTTVTYAKKGAPPAKPEIRTDKDPINLTEPMKVELFCKTTGVVIYYTTDGSDPTDSSSTRTQYSESFYVRQSCTLKAVAYSEEDRLYSEVASKPFKWKEYSISFASSDGNGKAYDERNKVITQAEAGAKIYLKADETISKPLVGKKVFSGWTVTPKSVSIENSNSFEEAYFIMPAGNVTVRATYTEKPAGVTVSGTAVSWNGTDDAEYYLYPTTTEDTVIRAQWKTGGTVEGYSYTGTKGDISPTTVDGKAMKSQSFRFDSVKAGDYKLVIFKPEKYVPKIVKITVSTTDYSCGEQKLWLYGDVNYNGVANTDDATQINRYYNGLGNIISKASPDELVEYLLAADVNCDGTVNTDDATQINRYYNGLGSCFAKLK